MAKVMFLLVSVILLTGGCVCYPSMHGRWYPSMPCSGTCLLGGCLLPGMSALGGSAPGESARGGVAFWCSLLVWPCGLVAFWLKVVFCYGLLVRPSGVIFCYGLLVRPFGVIFCYGLLVRPFGVIFCYGLLVWSPSVIAFWLKEGLC